MNWADGYVTDVEYLYEYQPEFNPLRQRLMFLASGLAVPRPKFACELGFGQGLSVNIHAAASAVDWWGTDFSPTHAGFARQLAELTGSEARLFDQAFADFCARPDLPDFDMIGLHGVWSWISDENRRVIVDFIRRRLQSGGVLYIGYNTLPGWGALAPVQHLIKCHDRAMAAQGENAARRMDTALNFVEQLLSTDPLYLRANPKIKENLKDIHARNPRYLAHEYLSFNWNPMHVADVARWLEPTRCSFACSANYIADLDELNLAAEQQELLRNIPDRILQETVRDFAVNARFRRDYWVKGARRLSTFEQAECLRAERVILGSIRASIPPAIAASRAKVDVSFYNPILDVLADYRPRSLAEIEQALTRSGVAFTQIVQAVMILAGAGFLQPVQDEQHRVRSPKPWAANASRLRPRRRAGQARFRVRISS